MKKLLKLAVIMLILAGSLGSCENQGEGLKQSTTLKGTRWKLVGIIDETGVLKELEPKECEECFTLVFNTDYTATVRSINHETLTLDLLNLNPNVNFEDVLRQELYDKDGNYYTDGDTFRRSVISTKSYSVIHDELTLSSNRNLLFKSQQL